MIVKAILSKLFRVGRHYPHRVHDDLTEYAFQLVHEPQDPRINPILMGRYVEHELPSPDNRIPFQLLGDHQRSIWWGGHNLPLEKIDTHFVTIGTAGSGKSLLTNITIASVLQNIKSGDEETLCILFETKAGYIKLLEQMGIPYELLNISDKRSVGLDISYDIRDYAQAEQFSHTLIKGNPKEGNSFWTKLARAILAGVSKTFLYLRLKYGLEYGLDDIYNVCVKDSKLLVEFLRLYPGNEGLINNVLTTSAEKTLDNLKMDLQSELQPLYMAATHCQRALKKFSITKFLKRELQQYQGENEKPKQVLVISQDLLAMESTRPFMQAMFETIATQINALSDSKTRRICIFLDEARFIGKLKSLHTLALFGRSRGARLFLTFQALEGFYEEYGKNDANEILANCGFKIVLKTLSPETAKWASSLFGQTEFYEVVYNPSYSGQGVSVSHHKQRVKREEVLDSQFLKLPYPSKEGGLTGFYLSPITQGYRETIPGEELERIKPEFDESVPDLVLKSPDEQVLESMSDEELRELIAHIRNLQTGTIHEEETDTNTRYKPETNEEKLRALLFDEAMEQLKTVVANININKS